MYRYDYNETVIHFAGLVKYTLDAVRQAASSYMNNDVIHDFIKEVTENAIETLIVTKNELVPL